MDVSSSQVVVSVPHKIISHSSRNIPTYRIDKDNTMSTYKIPLSNLCKLFSPNNEIDAKLRKLIISGEAPQFSENKAQDISFSETMTKTG